MITVNDYWMGRDETYASELTDAIRRNAATTVALVNELELASGMYLAVSSGWRPAAINAAVGGATHSNHTTACACDVHDPEGKLDQWCLDNLEVLERLGLWLESPKHTPGWCHVQTVPPKSGNRVFIP